MMPLSPEELVFPFLEANRPRLTNNPEDECRCSMDLSQSADRATEAHSCHDNHAQLSKELDTILDPEIIFRSPSQLDKIWPLFTNKQIDLPTKLAEYKVERFCSVAWPPLSIAFRCRTCSKTPTMAICPDCFKDGNHEGHDYNMFKSVSGGACDCGHDIIIDSGHCKRHRKNSKASRDGEQIPDYLLCVPRRATPRIIHRLAIQLRRFGSELSHEVDLYIDFLNKIANSCQAMRELIIETMISDQIYLSQIQWLSYHPSGLYCANINAGLTSLRREMKHLKPFKIPQNWSPPSKSIKAFCDILTPNNFIDELMLWTVVFEFPQKLVCFLLSFLMDYEYKKTFSRAFVNLYPRIVMSLCSTKKEPSRYSRQTRDSYEQFSRRILQVSIPIYSDSELTKLLSEEEYTLHSIIYCLRIAIEGSSIDKIKGVLKPNPLCANSKTAPKVVSCDHPIVGHRNLGSFTEVLGAMLKFDHETIRLINDKVLLNLWLETLSYFQTMSPYKRELVEHTPFETGPLVAIFLVESDFCIAPTWSLLSNLEGKQSLIHSKSLLQSIHEILARWLHQMGLGPNSLLDPYYMSFHIPLHRMFSLTIQHMLYVQNIPESELYNFLFENQSIFGSKYGYKPAFGPPKEIDIVDFLKIVLLHPLQALTLYYETRANMWTRNGLMTINQAVTYVHSPYYNSTIDLDMFLLKYCASKLNSNYFIKTLMSRFHAWKWLSFRSNLLMNGANLTREFNHFNILPEQTTQMVESSLVLILQLLTLNLTGHSSGQERARNEMIALISVIDRTYSYLVDMLSNGIDNTYEDFSPILKDIAHFKPALHGSGGNLQQGSYTLKPNIWEDEYDPIYVQYRFYQKRDLQMSLERFFQQAKLSRKKNLSIHSSSLWPPLKIPRNIGNFGHIDLSPLISCPAIVGIAYSILYKMLYINDVPDSIVAYAIHFIELALRKEGSKIIRKETRIQEEFKGKYLMKELDTCPSYFGSKGEAYIKGRTLFSKAESSAPLENMFPVVKYALDLAFERTWFPFESVLDNSLVHIEVVYSWPEKDFDYLIRCETEEEADQMAKYGDLPDQNSDWPVDRLGEGLEYEEEFTEDEELDDVNDDDCEDESTDEDENDGRDNGETIGENPTIESTQNYDNTFGSNVGNGFLGQADSFAAREDYGRNSPQTNLSNEVNSTLNQVARTQDRATNTGSIGSNSGDDHQQQQTDIEASSTTTTQNLTNTLISGISPGDFFAHPLQAAVDISRQVISSNDNDNPGPSNSQVQIDQQHSSAQEPLNSSVSGSMSGGNFINDVEMITVTYDGDHRQEDPIHQDQLEVNISDSSSSAAFIQEISSVTSQISSSSNSTTNTTRPIVSGEGDHTYSASVETQPMEVESLPESHSNALSLVPFNLEDRNNQPPSQVYPENLVTGRRAILASDPRPMLTGSTPPLALEGSENPRIGLSSSGSSIGRTNQDQVNSLSEVDIQARFMGFFSQSHPRQTQDSHHHHHQTGRRTFGVRQTARRGGFHPMPPFVVTNPNNNSRPAARSSRSTATIRSALEIETESSDGNRGSRPIARRSRACTLINRALLTRSQQENQHDDLKRNRRLRKDRMHHGESLLSLLLRLHAKYSQKARSYEYNEERAEVNCALKRSRIGDGVHFVTIVLDLICNLDQRMRGKLSQLQELIWGNSNKGGDSGEKVECSGDIEIEIKTNSSNTEHQQQHQPIESKKGGLMEGAKTTSCSSSDDRIKSGSFAGTSGSRPEVAVMSPTERRRRAKEFQNRLMAEFATKQKAFIEKYESDKSEISRRSSASISIDEEPINLSSKLSYKESCSGTGGGSSSSGGSVATTLSREQNLSDRDKKNMVKVSTQNSCVDKSVCLTNTEQQQSKDNNNKKKDDADTNAKAVTAGKEVCSQNLPIYECCICGDEGPSDLANPLGQVVLLQSTSIYGHSHLRPKSGRILPCEEGRYMRLKEETYAKYLERRIDLLYEHFSESSRLDSINIGADGGVHVQSCGHYLHIECHQSYIKSLDQEDRLRSRNDRDEFLCPLCRQLANSVLPILSDIHRPGHLSVALVSSEDLDDQIKLIGSLLEHRLPPNPKELQSSAAFCSHLTKATPPHCRLVKCSASMHSLFLFLTSITRTNLETEIIVRTNGNVASNSTYSGKPPPGKCSTTQASTSKASQLHQQQGDGISTRRNCFQLLFHVLALNAQTLINDQWFTCDQIWSYLTHRIDEKNRLAVKPINSEVPLLLRDPTAMLLQFLFAITSSLCYQTNFTCLVQILFNLTAIQSIALVLSYVKPNSLNEEELKGEERFDREGEEGEPNRSSCGLEEIKRVTEEVNEGKICRSRSEFSLLLTTVGENLAPLLSPTTEEPLMNSTFRDSWHKFEGSGIYSIENRVKLACLPFLRAAAYIQHQLYDKTFPDLTIVSDKLLSDEKSIDRDFEVLTSCLSLCCSRDFEMKERAQLRRKGPERTQQLQQQLQRQQQHLSLVDCLNWPKGEEVDLGSKLISSWSTELLRFASEFSIAARSLLICRPLAWYRPSLMQLPKSFDDIFMFYYRKKCSLCHQVPKDVAICMVCGAPICFRVSCCKDRSRSRQVHSQHCGSNTAVFLAVHTSSVVVIRRNRACIWGSVYLDAHDEEDNGLQRGKPLYLVQERFNLLEEQWLTHSFDHTCGKRWIYLQETQ